MAFVSPLTSFSLSQVYVKNLSKYQTGLSRADGAALWGLGWAGEEIEREETHPYMVNR